MTAEKHTQPATDDLQVRAGAPEELFQAIFQGSLDGLALLRLVGEEAKEPADFVYVAVNRAFEEMTGRSRTEVVGHRWGQVFPQVNWEWVKENLLPLAVNGQAHRFELFSQALQQHIEALAYVPAPGYLVFSFRDISARRQAETEREEALANLRERVKEASLLQEAGLLLSRRGQSIPQLLAGLVRLIPGGWQDPEHTAARIAYDDIVTATPDFHESKWQQQVTFTTSGGRQGSITVAYLGPVDEAGAAESGAVERGPFLAEEQATLEALARMVHADLERRQAEARLRLQAQVLDSLQDAVVATDLAGKIIYWGQGAQRALGVDAAEALGRPFAPILQVPAETADRLGHEMLEKGSWRGEYELRDGEGQPRRLSLRVSAVKDDAGDLLGYVGIGRDITERHQREEQLVAITRVARALRDARRPADLFSATLEQVRALLQVNGAAIALKREGDTVHFEATTERWRHVEGITLQAGEGITGKVLASHRPFVSENLAEEEALALPDLFSMPMAGVCSPLIASDSFAGVLWVIRERAFSVAELRLVEAVSNMVAGTLERVSLFEQVETQALQMQRMMDAMEEGLLLLNEEREIVLANPAAERYLALLTAETGGEAPWQPPGGRSLESLLEPPPAGAVAHELVAAGTPPQKFELLAHPVAPPGAESAAAGGWVLVLRDVTEVRRLQEQTQQQERLAAVGQLAAGIAHDFNNLLSAIVLYAQMLQQSPNLDEKDRRRMALIFRQATLASDLIRQILDFSRRSVLTREELDLVPLLSDTVAMLQRTLPENVHISWEPPRQRFVVEGDRNRLQQVLMNLAINARDALPGGGALTVSLGHLQLQPGEPGPLPGLRAGEWARLEVRDDGQGIAAADLPHIFEPFFTTKGPGEGAGLGLAQVYGITHQHGGQIRVESAPGQGATFTIYLPLLAPVEERPPAQPVAEEPAGVAATILVVEDEPAVREALAATLEMLGYRVLVADDGHTALTLFAEEGEQIDLVLSDLVMARMGGEQLYHRLHALRPDLKMIVITGYPLQHEGKALLEQGIVGWIQKPVTLDVLQERIEEALRS